MIICRSLSSHISIQFFYLSYFQVMYQLSTKSWYDSVCECYRQLIIVSPKPTQPLLGITKLLQPSRLSPFKNFSDCDAYPSCFYAILDPNDTTKSKYLTIDELPVLLCFLKSNGYTIDYQMTKIMQKAKTTIGETLLFYIN